MGDAQRWALELRAIQGSTKAALAKAGREDDRHRIRIAADGLLARLEDRVLRDGGDLGMLEAIDQARHDVWD